MKAICKTAAGDSPRLVDVPIPKPGMKEVLVKVHYAGICKTDLKIARGELKSLNGRVILGHEFSGEVVSLGFGCDKLNAAGDMKVRVGDLVVANPMLDDESDKMIGKDVNGCFAEYVVVPMENILDVSHYIYDADDSVVKALAYAEPVAAALGPLQVLQRAVSYLPEAIGAHRVVIAGNPDDRIAKLLAKCLEDLGHKPLIVPPEKMMIDYDLSGKKYKSIVECCPEFAGKLLKCLENKGTLVLKSRGYVGFDNVLVNDIVMRELCIVGAKYSSFYNACTYILQNREDLLRDLIEDRDYKLEEFEEAFKSASAKDAKKVMFKCVQQQAQ